MYAIRYSSFLFCIPGELILNRVEQSLDYLRKNQTNQIKKNQINRQPVLNRKAEMVCQTFFTTLILHNGGELLNSK